MRPVTHPFDTIAVPPGFQYPEILFGELAITHRERCHCFDVVF